MRTTKRIVKIHEIDGYNIYCLFNNGESRIINFKEVFKKWAVKKGDLEFPLIESISEFKKVKLVDGALAWKNITFNSTDENGQKVIHHYDLDPIVMYEASKFDESREVEIALLIKQERKELGLTQEKLAHKSGISKSYISRIENNKAIGSLSTLIKIIEDGLGKTLPKHHLKMINI